MSSLLADESSYSTSLGFDPFKPIQNETDELEPLMEFAQTLQSAADAELVE